jgi:hypothetical protein
VRSEITDDEQTLDEFDEFGPHEVQERIDTPFESGEVVFSDEAEDEGEPEIRP